MRSIFSLDPCTTPCVDENIANDTPLARAVLYTTKRESQVRHLGDIINLKFSLASDSKYQIDIVAKHPHEFLLSHTETRTQIFLVDLDWSDFSNYWLIESKNDFDNNIARLRSDEVTKYLRLCERSDVQHVNLNAMLDVNQWQQEYERINAIMDLPAHLPAAQKIYDFWYDLRVAKYVKEFQNLTLADNAYFYHARSQEQIHGTLRKSPTQWRAFYENVRDPSWPDCKNERDFHKLPDHVKHELITVFKYQPLDF